MELPVQVNVDNVGAIFMSENTTSSNRTRHMDTRWRFVNQLQEDGLIKIEFVKSEDNISDIMTKNVTGEIHDVHLGEYLMEKKSVDPQDREGVGEMS